MRRIEREKPEFESGCGSDSSRKCLLQMSAPVLPVRLPVARCRPATRPGIARTASVPGAARVTIGPAWRAAAAAGRRSQARAYASTGTGPPLVRAAHWLSSLDHDWQTPVWRPWNEALSAHHTLTQYDSRGCGLSDRDADDFTLASLVADLESVVDAAGLERFALLGISQGGAVSIAYAAKHPQRVSRLVLCGAFARGGMHRDRTPAQVQAREAMVTLVELGWAQDNPAFLQMFTSQFFPSATTLQANAFNEIQRRATSPRVAARLMRAFSQIDASDLLPQVTAPTLVFHSRGDCRVPFDEGRFVASSIANARFDPLDCESHVPLLGDPAFDHVQREIRQFLDPAPALAAPFPELTQRERQVLELIACGRDNAQIAAHLGLAGKTVRNHITAIFDKIGAENRAQAIVRARVAGMGSA